MTKTFEMLNQKSNELTFFQTQEMVVATEEEIIRKYNSELFQKCFEEMA